MDIYIDKDVIENYIRFAKVKAYGKALRETIINDKDISFDDKIELLGRITKIDNDLEMLREILKQTYGL